MTHISAAMDMDLSKLVRNITRAVAGELTRTVAREGEDQTPLQVISGAVSTQVGYLTSADLLRIERKVDALADLIKSEAERGNRLALGLSATGEIPIINKVS